jgi:phenylalanyl-tRNA synthetase beta chain
MAVAMEGIEIAESPKWLQDRLIAAAVRPINNIVDITNYVMMELGQPMHAFDASQLDKISVRRAKKGEILKTLDGEERKLDEEMLLITDGEKPLAIAGVMGGEDSEVVDDTNSIIFESANFDFVSIRKTSTKLGLRTESSVRFEKGLDPNLCEVALSRAVELVKELCPKAKVISQVVDEKSFALNQGPIKLDLAWLNNYIGNNLESKKVSEVLEKLGFEVTEREDYLEVLVPTWRSVKDISIREDLAEEVARIIGYNNLEPEMPMVEMKVPEINEKRKLERNIKNILSRGAGLNEVYNYSFVGEEQLEKMGINHSDYIKLANPIASQHTLLRQNLATNLLNNVKTNQVRFDEIGMFEIGSVYLPIDGGLEKGDGSKESLPYQEKRLAILVADNSKDAFSRAKGVLEYLMKELKVPTAFVVSDMVPNWVDKTQSAQINSGQAVLGTAYKLDKNIKSKLGIKKETVIIELSLNEIENVIKNLPAFKHQEFDKFPPVVRDLAFVVNEKMLYADILSEIVNHHDYLKDVDVFDVYQGDKLGEGKKSLAFHLSYQADKTLTAEEVDKIQKDLIKKLEDKFEAKVRDF